MIHFDNKTIAEEIIKSRRSDIVRRPYWKLLYICTVMNTSRQDREQNWMRDKNNFFDFAFVLILKWFFNFISDFFTKFMNTVLFNICSSSRYKFKQEFCLSRFVALSYRSFHFTDVKYTKTHCFGHCSSSRYCFRYMRQCIYRVDENWLSIGTIATRYGEVTHHNTMKAKCSLWNWCMYQRYDVERRLTMLWYTHVHINKSKLRSQYTHTDIQTSLCASVWIRVYLTFLCLINFYRVFLYRIDFEFYVVYWIYVLLVRIQLEWFWNIENCMQFSFTKLVFKAEWKRKLIFQTISNFCQW